ncbi:MAG: signal recognition particle protein [Pseudomonadota bacterium]|nr:signal recognition particle protein [Pseudomonadota bacterium]
MFQSLSKSVTQAFRQFSGKDKLTQAMIDAGCDEIEAALIEADVADIVVSQIISDFKSSVLNTPVPPEAKQGDFLVKLFHDELVSILGKEDKSNFQLSHKPSVIMLAGLQGAGKTTYAARLAKQLKSKQKKVLVCSCDIYRPAAIEQLQVLAEQAKVECFLSDPNASPLSIATDALKQAKTQGFDVLIIDTAGRLHVDQAMMQECHDLAQLLKPQELLFVMDSMTGQDAAITAKSFNDQLSLTGVVLTKVDADTRGGAALSSRYIVGKPIKHMTIGEHIDDLDDFQAERIAGQILGMGDIVSLIKQLEQKVDKEKSAQLLKKITGSGEFDFNDLRSQIMQLQSMGGLQSIISKLPMMGDKIAALGDKLNEDQHKVTVNLIDSMTSQERARPFLVINVASRQRRIIQGSGRTKKELKDLLNQYNKMKKMTAKMKGKRMDQMMAQMKDMFSKKD